MTTVPRSIHPWLLLLVIDGTVPVVVAWKHYGGEATTAVALISAFLTLLILNAVIVLRLRSRKVTLGQETPRGFYLGAVCLAVISGVLTSVAVHSTPERNEYARLAFSNTSLDEIKPRQKALVVELIRRNASASKAEERAALQTKPIFPELYSPGSFANEKVIRSVSEQYKKANDLDITYRTEVERNWSEFRDKMSKVDPDYLKSFEAASKENRKQDERAFQLEQQCAIATLGLYGYADTHSREITLSDGKLHFTHDDVRAEFTRQLEERKSLNQQSQQVLQELLLKRQQSRTSMGISPNTQDWRLVPD